MYIFNLIKVNVNNKNEWSYKEKKVLLNIKLKYKCIEKNI